MATAKKPAPKKSVAKKGVATKASPKKAVSGKAVSKKTAVNKAVAKKPVAAKTTKRSGGKKKHIVRRILDFKIKGWVSRKTVIIGGVVAVLLVGGFAGYAVWQNMSANAGGTCTLGRSQRVESGIRISTKVDKVKYQKCLQAAQAATAAKIAAVKAAERQAAAKAAAAKVAAANATAAKVAAEKAAAAKAAAAKAVADKAKIEAAKLAAANAGPKGWTEVGTTNYDYPNNIEKFTATLYVCKKNATDGSSMLKSKAIVNSAANVPVSTTLSASVWMQSKVYTGNKVALKAGNQSIASSPIYIKDTTGVNVVIGTYDPASNSHHAYDPAGTKNLKFTYTKPAPALSSILICE